MKIKKTLLLLVVETMILFVILGGVGCYSVNNLKKEITEQLVYLDTLEEMASTLNYEILTNRRWEKDLFLNAASPQTQRDYLNKFKESGEKVTTLLIQLPEKLEKYPELNKRFERTLISTAMEYSLYHDTVISIALKSIEDPTIPPRELNKLMMPTKDHIYNCEQNISDIYNVIEDYHNDNIDTIVHLSTQYTLLLILLAIFSAFILAIILLIHRSHVMKGITLLAYKIAEFASGSSNLSQKITWTRNDEFAEIVKNINIFRDNLRNIYTRIAENEENLRTTLNSIGDGVVVTDSNANIVQMNPVSEKLSAHSQDSSFGKSIDEIIQLFSENKQHELAPVIVSMRNTPNPEVIHFEANLVSQDGATHIVSTTVSAIRHHEGSFFGAVLVFRDVTIEQKLKERVMQNDKMESIGQLAGGVAHDFNNMLGGISGVAELLLMESPNENQRKYLNMILDTTTRAATLNNQLLTFSRKNNNSSASNIHKVFSAHKAINDAVEILKHSVDKKVAIVVNNHAEKDLIIGDAVQFQNAILNLGINARDALDDNGSIAISTKNITVTETYIKQLGANLKLGEYIHINFVDNGKGMDEETKKRIFEPFFTTKDVGKGTGLGLAAVFGTIKELNGNITVYSELGTGTTFHILLPLTAETPVEESDEMEITHGKGTILIVDDEELLRKVAASILENAGYSILFAQNGKEGVEVFTQHKESIDLVILDMIMPVMDGRDCYKKIHEISPETPVIMASGYTSDLRVQEIKALGVKELIAKPYRAAKLTATVYEALKK